MYIPSYSSLHIFSYAAERNKCKHRCVCVNMFVYIHVNRLIYIYTCIDWDMDRDTTHDFSTGDASVSKIGILLL